MTDYQKQGTDFLNKTGVIFEIVYLRYGIHFEGDNAKRDIYRAKFTRKGRSFSVDFGQSLNESSFKLKLPNGKITHVFSREQLKECIGKNGTINKLLFANRFFSLSGLKVLCPQKPTAYAVLCCLQKHDPGTFNEFCREYGYSEDSRTAERTYKGAKEEYQKVLTLWDDDEIELLQEIQ